VVRRIVAEAEEILGKVGGRNASPARADRVGSRASRTQRDVLGHEEARPVELGAVLVGTRVLGLQRRQPEMCRTDAEGQRRAECDCREDWMITIPFHVTVKAGREDE